MQHFSPPLFLLVTILAGFLLNPYAKAQSDIQNVVISSLKAVAIVSSLVPDYCSTINNNTARGFGSIVVSSSVKTISAVYHQGALALHAVEPPNTTGISDPNDVLGHLSDAEDALKSATTAITEKRDFFISAGQNHTMLSDLSTLMTKVDFFMDELPLFMTNNIEDLIDAKSRLDAAIETCERSFSEVS